MLEKAICIAIDRHSGQKDLAGEPYILHPLRVMSQMATEEERILAVLHDTVEDTGLTLEEVAREFSQEIANKLDLLTHKREDKYADYVVKLSQNATCRRVKLADLRDNLKPERNAKLENNYENRKRTRKYIYAVMFLTGQLTKEHYLSGMEVE